MSLKLPVNLIPVLALLYLIPWSPLVGQTIPDLDRERRLSTLADSLPQVDLEFAEIDILSVGLETLFAPGTGPFFSRYRALGGTVENLNPVAAPTSSLRIGLGSGLRFTGTVAWMNTGFDDRYFAYLRPEDENLRPVATGAVVETFELEAVPLLLGLQFSPVASQFTSYLGASVGGAIVSSQWITSSESISTVNFNRPQRNQEALQIVPAARAYLGLDLRFDRYIYERTSFRGVFVELGWSWIGVRDNWFREISILGRGFSELPEDDPVYMNVGGVFLTIGANLQFYGSRLTD